MKSSIPDELRDVANVQLAEIVAKLPTDAEGRFVLFVEVARFLDYWSIFGHVAPFDRGFASRDLDLLLWGWNEAVAHLFVPVEHVGGFPLMESSLSSQRFACHVLQEFGKVSLTRRLADMAECGLLNIRRCDKGYIAQMASEANAQFLDLLDVTQLQRTEEELWTGGHGIEVAGWQIFDTRQVEAFVGKPQSLLARAAPPVKGWLRDDLEELMIPLIRPWDTGRGVMMAYGAREDLDKHYLAVALDQCTKWRSAAGMHPHASFGQLTGEKISAVVVVLASLHAKHIGFAGVASRHFREISLPQSLTIWTERQELEASVSELTGMSKHDVGLVFDAVCLRPHQAKRLHGHTTPFIPLLFDLGNGMVLRSPSCLTKNPFESIKQIQHWSDSRAEHVLAADREAWMRSDLYRLFMGRRYKCVDGSVKVRRGSDVVTDIDAAVYDKDTHDIGLFQLKWQDYSTNDVRQLTSKARNLAHELDQWSEKIGGWIDEAGTEKLGQTMRLNQRHGHRIRNVYLFGISQVSARPEGYGHPIKGERIAVGTWSQFVRLRVEGGPATEVLGDLHAGLCASRSETLATKPIPVTVTLGTVEIHLENFWHDAD